jgi:hypothetical protein
MTTAKDLKTETEEFLKKRGFAAARVESAYPKSEPTGARYVTGAIDSWRSGGRAGVEGGRAPAGRC